MANKCKECGCSCRKCLASDHDVQLHVEIENLKQRLVEKENHIVMMETNFLNEANKFPNGELMAVKEELLTWQDKYKSDCRLYDAHRRVQRVNQGLEDKLLKLVDVCETDKTTLTRDVATLSHSLAEANYAIKKLTGDNERYKNDVSLAIQFLQCKQTNFVAHRFDSLPSEVQTQVAVYMNNKRKPLEEKRAPLEPKSIKVPIPTFPPTAMVYSVPKSPKLAEQPLVEDQPSQQVDIVSAAIMAKVLEERQKEKALAKHCDTCTCAKSLKIIYEVSHHHIGTQTGPECRENVVLPQAHSTGLSILKTVVEKSKRSSPYPNLVAPLPLEAGPNPQNVVKVQPNNFLIETTHTVAVQKPEDDAQGLPDLIEFEDVGGLRVLEVPHLNEEEEEEEKRAIDKSSLVGASEVLRGPRYASMLVQSGSKNILLDNAHNSIAPVLYTRSVGKVKQPSSQNIQNSSQKPDSCSVSSHGSKHMSVVSENSTQHQQRISDWVQITVEQEISSPDNSRTEELKIDPKKEQEIKQDKARYAEMEENVKRFLFGESDFWKTVEIGKLKYKSYQEGDRAQKPPSEGSRTSSHMETEI
ncbi:uncharacterized protein LOC109534312 isoform X1 [Dendroctonus ponderosae]|uniref:uncharacterized protein LOC109534312 isoform X1 n=1 Tax=Dendroctonus ponderosae TaxID=77166 RepID=UPI002034A815|nr:uncharacterized protein LOC109534312 isoform X1 [Dendroctonus ponderosae]